MKTVMVSGGFDPLHVGHVRMINSASGWGKVIVALNSDAWLKAKKGYVFMSWLERAEILRSLANVHEVVMVNDEDGTVCSALNGYKPNYFANGGDRNTANPQEHETCQRLGIIELFHIGGGKVQSSSELVRKFLKEDKS